MDKRTELRFECLKLAYRPDRSEEQIMTTAKILENFVLEASKESSETPRPNNNKKGNRRNKSGNPDILS